MALTDKDIVITPNKGSSTDDPKIVFSGADASTAAQNITLKTYPTSNGTLSFEGSAGQLFSITNSLSGTIFSVNDISGIPSIEVLDTGLVKIAQYGGNILLGTSTDNGSKLQVNGSITGNTFTSTIATGTAPFTVSSTTAVTNLNVDYLDGQHGSYYTTAGNLSGTIPSAVLGNSTHYIGTTAIALNRASASQTLTGVSIDGSAGSADNIDGIAFKNADSSSSFVVDTQGTNGIGYSTGYSLFGQSDGGVYCSTYSSSWQHQINGDFRTGQIAIRGKNNGTWQAWRTVLDSSNYSTYASPLAGSSSLTTTGTVTSGTWSGSFGAVSGANLTSLTAGNLSGTIPSAVLGNSTHYIGTTAIALNRASASQSLTGITSIDGYATRISDATAGLRIANPGGGSYATNTASVTGAIKIKLPTATFKSNTMMRFTVRIYEYTGGASGTARTIEVGGYNYSDASANWVNYFATQSTMGGSDINVRFGNDGTSQCIWIGDTANVWSYPQVFITDFQGGYSNYTDALWGTGWAISFVTALDTVTQGPIIAAKNLTSQNYSTYASPLAGSSSLTTTGTITSGTWSGSFGAVSGANLTSLTAGNLSGTIPSAVLGNSTHYIGTTAIALNRASAVQTLSGVNIDGQSVYIQSPDGTRDAATRLPNTNTRNVRFDFCGATSAGTGGNYAGVMTYAPWDGTTASTGDASYQLAFGSTATNGSGIPKLNIRNGIDTTWNSWYTILHSGNYSTYASPLAGSSSLTTTGTITSGTWSGSFGAVSGANLTNLTAGNLSGTIPSAVLGNSTHYIGTTAIALNRASASQSLTGVSIDGSAGSATNIAGGAAGNVHYQSGAGATAFVTNGTSGQVLTCNGASAPTWTTISGGATITDDTSTNSSFYPVFTSTTSGTMSAAKVSTTKMYFNPSTGTLSSTVFNALSDINYKTNINIIDNPLSIIKLVEAVEFDWVDSGLHSSGVIAQQLETVLPFLVDTTEEGKKSVNYSGIIAYLIGAVKELSDKVEVLENR